MSTFSDVEAKGVVTSDSLLGILDRWIASSIKRERLSPFATLGIDEIALLKGHGDYMAVISAVADLNKEE